MTDEPRLQRQVELHPYPLLFVAVSGAHLYGFRSPDSDYDLRGVHLLPLREVVGLKTGPETVEKAGDHDGLEIDLVTHDARKFFGLLLKKNGYVLEQVFSPLVVHTTPEHAELKEIARTCVTRHHAHHYLGFAETQWRLFQKEDPPKVKPLLSMYTPRQDVTATPRSDTPPKADAAGYDAPATWPWLPQGYVPNITYNTARPPSQPHGPDAPDEPPVVPAGSEPPGGAGL
jgi:predicted nucleotidyltransferase